MKKRIFAMDFVRTIATMIIIILHFNISVHSRGMSPFMILKNDFVNINLAYIGVSTFFVLSGFSLMLSTESRYSILNFYMKRFKAIYPMFWIGYALVTVYYFLKYHSICPWGGQPSKISFLLTIVGLDGYTTSLGTNWYKIGEWFLGCIILIYLIFPVLKWGIDRFEKICWIPWFVIYVYLIFNYQSAIPQAQNVLVRLPEFLIGMYICKYRDKITGRSACISCLGFLIILLVPLSSIPLMFLVTLTGACCFIMCYWLGEQIKNVGIQKPFSWFAKYSFAIYLMHHVISEQIVSIFEGMILSRGYLWLLFIIVVASEILGGYMLMKLTNVVLEKFDIWKMELCQKEV